MLNDNQTMEMLIREMLSKYNDQSMTVKIIDSLKKSLDDSVYWMPENVFREEALAADIVKRVKQIRVSGIKEKEPDTWSNLVISDLSPFNNIGNYSRKALTDKPLKLTINDRNAYRTLREKLSHTEHILCAGYNRIDSATLLTAIRKQCGNPGRAAFRVLQQVVSTAQQQKETVNKNHLILAARFFLENLFGKTVEI